MPTTATSPDTPTSPDGSFDAGPYYVQLRISDYVRPTPFDKPSRANTYTVRLPIPTELREESSTEWSSPSLGAVGDLINGQDGASAFNGALAGTALGNVGNVPGAFVDQMFGSTGAGGALGSALKNTLPAENLTSAFQQSFGIAPNPNQTMIFQGPQLRSFTFSWTFNPRTKDESKRYQRIINKIRARSLPTFAAGNASAILKYPSIVQMNFYPWDSMGPSDNTYYGWSTDSIIKMKTCVISNVIANYAPGNIPAFFEGTRLPTVIQLTITLKETEYMLGGDYDSNLQTQETLGALVEQVGIDIAAAFGIEPTETPPAANPVNASEKEKNSANPPNPNPPANPVNAGRSPGILADLFKKGAQ
jgi:hypothetical protein